MKVKSFTQFPLHVLLLPCFFIWHIYNEYLTTIQAGLYLKYLGIYLLLSFVIFITGKLLYKNNYKAGCWTASLLIPFFFWGSFIDFLRKIAGSSFLSSYTFLLPFFFALIALYTFLLLKKKPPVKLNLFLNILFTIFILIETCTTAIKLLNKEGLKKNLAYFDKELGIRLQPQDTRQQPDIFFIVFDEYASSKALRKYFHFDNNLIDSSLHANGFFISTGSQSNYNSTTLSIASTLNMQYFNQDLEHRPNDAPMLLKGIYSFKKSFLPKLLEQYGYDILNFGLFDFENHPALVPAPLENYKISALSLETFWGRMRTEIYWNISVRLPGYTGKYPPKMNYINRNSTNFTRFINQLNSESSRPRFVFSHLLLPRRPAYVDRYGKPRYTSLEDLQDQKHDSLYLQQLLYANTLIDSLAKAAHKPHARPLVLIIEGDHGNRYAEEGLKFREKHFMNLNVYYFSDTGYTSMYDTISPVNTFRVVLNKYFNAGLPLLNDSTVMLD